MSDDDGDVEMKAAGDGAKVRELAVGKGSAAIRVFV
jgi:hypothetical protein